MKYTELEKVKTQDIVRIMCEKYPEYEHYEYLDMIRIFLDTIENVIQDQSVVVQLENFGNFYYVEGKFKATPLSEKLLGENESIRRVVKFKPSRSMQDRIRKKSREKGLVK